ncbi:hypothetical protein E4U38_007745, partial [Claviceps purpurea]
IEFCVDRGAYEAIPFEIMTGGCRPSISPACEASEGEDTKVLCDRPQSPLRQAPKSSERGKSDKPYRA